MRSGPDSTTIAGDNRARDATASLRATYTVPTPHPPPIIVPRTVRSGALQEQSESRRLRIHHVRKHGAPGDGAGRIDDEQRALGELPPASYTPYARAMLPRGRSSASSRNGN